MLLVRFPMIGILYLLTRAMHAGHHWGACLLRNSGGFLGNLQMDGGPKV